MRTRSLHTRARIVAAASAAAIGLGLLTSTSGIAQTVAANNSTARDIVFVVDSTGLTQQQWLIQKRAYLAMLDDRRSFPLDGTLAISFIQYASTAQGGQASRVTLPLTKLTGEAAMGAATKAIKEATLLAPEKAGVDGLTAAAQELSERGTKGAPADICTTANAPWLPATLTKGTAAVKGAGATRLSVLAVTSPSLSDIVAARDFGSSVFGDGVVTSVKDMPQFSTLVDAACQLPSVRLEAIEVNQAIQDWNNSVPLVKYKDTIVRVFLETVAGPDRSITGLLHGERDGVPLSNSPLTPINDGGSTPIGSYVDSSSKRADLDSSLNFRLPTSWLSGDVTLTFEAPSSMTCGAAPVAQRDCDVDVSFREAVEPPVDYVSVPYEYLGVLREPSDLALVENMYRTEDAFPVRYVDFDFDWLTMSVDDTIPDLEAVNALLELYRLYEWLDDPDVCDPDCSYYYGVLDGSGGGLANGIPGTVASGFLSGTTDPEAYGYGRNRGPHEIAHMVAAHHIVNKAENGTKSYDWGRVKKGWCTEEGSLSAPEFPYWEYSSSYGYDVPTLGPPSATDTQIWGVAPRFVGDNENLAVIDPRYVFPMMSYCGALDSSSQWRWPSIQTYDALADELLDGASRRLPVARAIKPSATLVVRGIVDADDTSSVRFLPVAPVTFPRAPEPTAGDWSLRILDRSGKPVMTRQFTMSESHGDAAVPNGGEPPRALQFAVPFPATIGPRIGTIQLLKDSVIVASEKASRESPSVSVSAPKKGARIEGDSVTVTWAASDGDSESLSATVLYRPSAKSAWKPIAIDVSGSSVTVPRRAIDGSRMGEFMVVASDGIRLASAKTGPVRVADNPPLLSASASQARIVAAQNLSLEAVGWDREDGVLDQQISWTSSIDGRIGQGRNLDLLATDLSEGRHVITARVMDAAKNSVRATVTVVVSRVAEQVPFGKD